jgi:hypothetical protein
MWGRCLPLLLIALPAFAGEPKPTKVSWRFANVVEGFDHNHQMVITADGAELATSEPGPETAPGSMTVRFPANAEVRVVSVAEYEGVWEEHTMENDYSVDCVWEFTVKARPPKKVDLLCDIDDEASAKVR